jgi:hypothetical protein
VLSLRASGYDEELSMLFLKHPFFLSIGIITNEWQLAWQKASFKKMFFNFLILACQPAFIHFNACQ